MTLQISEFAISVDELSHGCYYDFRISSTIHIVCPKWLMCKIHAGIQKYLGNAAMTGSIIFTTNFLH